MKLIRCTPCRKYTATLLVTIMLVLSMTGFCRGEDHSARSAHAQAHQAEISSLYALDVDIIPGAPCGHHHHSADGDDCASCACCFCHAPLLSGPVLISYQPFVLLLPPAEPFRALPEVFLAKFIPPQNLS